MKFKCTRSVPSSPPSLPPPFSLSFSWFYTVTCRCPRLTFKCQVLVQFPLKICDHPPNSLNLCWKSKEAKKYASWQEGDGEQRLIFNRIHECTYDLPRQICKTIFRHTHAHKCRLEYVCVSCHKALYWVGYAGLLTSITRKWNEGLSWNFVYIVSKYWKIWIYKKHIVLTTFSSIPLTKLIFNSLCRSWVNVVHWNAN